MLSTRIMLTIRTLLCSVKILASYFEYAISHLAIPLTTPGIHIFIAKHRSASSSIAAFLKNRLTTPKRSLSFYNCLSNSKNTQLQYPPANAVYRIERPPPADSYSYGYSQKTALRSIFTGVSYSLSSSAQCPTNTNLSGELTFGNCREGSLLAR